MTNNRQNQSLNLYAASMNTTSALQRRSSVFPVIEFMGKNQTLTANVSALVEWNEVLRQTDQPLSTWRGNDVANFVWPVYISPGTGSVAYQIKFNAAGYYQFFLSCALQTANAGTLIFEILSDTGFLLQTTQQTFTSQNLLTYSMMAYVNRGYVLQCKIRSTVNNVLLTSDQRSTILFGPSPRLIIAQIAQFDDSNVGKMTRVQSTQTIAAINAIPTAITYNTQPAAAATNVADGYTYNAGGSNQLDAYDGTLNDRITVKEDGVYLINGQITIVNDATNVGTRTIILAANGATVLASQSLAANANSGRWLNVSIIYSLIAGDYVQVYGLQNSGSNRNMTVFTAKHSLSVTLLST